MAIKHIVGQVLAIISLVCALLVGHQANADETFSGTNCISSGSIIVGCGANGSLH